MSSVRCILYGSFVAMAGWGAAAQKTEPAVRSQPFSRSGPACVMTVPPDAPLYPVTGHVIDNRTGQPLAGASVSLSSDCWLPHVDGQPDRNAWSEKVTSDDKGEFRFSGVPAMPVFLGASLDGYQVVMTIENRVTSYRVSADTSPITLRLASLPSISGVVRGADGAPMANAQVLLIYFNSEAGWPMRTLHGAFRTGADGSYVFPHRPPGRWELIASVPRSFQPPRRDQQGRYMGYVPVRYPKLSPGGPHCYLELSEGQQATADFELREQVLHRITGTTNVSTAIVDVVDSSGAGDYNVRTTGPQSRGFEAWVPKGRFWLESDFTSAYGEFIGSLPVEVGDTDIEGIEFPLMPRNHVTIPVEISAASPDQIGLVRQMSAVRTHRLGLNGYAGAGDGSTMTGWMRDTGATRTESIAAVPGSYAIALAASGKAYAQSISRGGIDLIREPLVIKPGAEQETIRVVLAEGASVEGVVRRVGNPVRGLVYAIPEQPDGRLLQWVRSDADGKFRVDGLAPARYLLFASDVEVPLDGQTASEFPAHWQQLGQGLTLEAGKTTSLDLEVNKP